MHRDDEASRSWWLVYFTGGMLVVAFMQVLAFVWQLAMTRRAVRDAASAAKAAMASADAADASARAFQTAQRAWIGYESALVHSLNVDGQPNAGIAFQIVWKNAGQSPAIQCRVWATVLEVDAQAGVPHFPPQDNFSPEQICVPSASMTSALVSIATVGPWLAGGSRLYIYGRVEYQDIFHQGIVRHTEITQAIGRTTSYDAQGNEQTLYMFTPVGPQNTAS